PFIKDAGPGLDSGPFDRQTVGVEAELPHELEILPPPMPGLASIARTVWHQPELLRLPPIRVPILAFRLVRGGGSTPQETVRKPQLIALSDQHAHLSVRQGGCLPVRASRTRPGFVQLPSARSVIPFTPRIGSRPAFGFPWGTPPAPKLIWKHFQVSRSHAKSVPVPMSE